MIFNNRQRTAIVIFLILLSIGAGLYPQGSNLSSADVHPIVKLGRLLSYVLIPLLILEQWKRFVYVATRNKSLLFLVGMALFSVFWSDSPDATIEQGKGLIRTTLFGIYLATQYSIREQLQLFSGTISIAALLSWFVCLALPSFGISDETLGWRGIFYHKNDLGDVMSVGIVLFFLLSQQKSKERWFNWLNICLCIPLLVLANAKTPLIGLITMIALMPFHKILRQKYTLKVPILIVATICLGVLAVWLASNFEVFITAIGKDPRLNGRTDIWAIVVQMIKQRPWLGYGYNGFWANPDNVAEVHRQYFSSWIPGHAHNGILTLLLDVGIVGLILFLINFFNAFRDSVLFARFSKTIEGIFPIQVISALAVVNVSGNSILNAYGSSIWLLYTATVFSLSIYKDRARKQTYLRHKFNQSTIPTVSS
jgi:O-antigen ligase